MSNSVPAKLHEPFLTDARQYVQLAEARNGPIPRPLDDNYVWGDALAELAFIRPDARIINLESAVTLSGSPWQGKGIHYRMHPDNVGILQSATVDCCVLANNHVLDWGYAGLDETLASLRAAGIRHAGAGRDNAAASSPAIIPLADASRVLVFGCASTSSGVPRAWQAGINRPGVNLITGGIDGRARSVFPPVCRKRPGDIFVVSIHWGGNWGYGIHPQQRDLAHALIDEAGVDVVHGHSSHHAKGIEVYRGRLILYGCGDLINDYEGIRGHEHHRPDLVLMYFPTLARDSGRLLNLTLTPMQIRRFRLQRATKSDAQWLLRRLNHEGDSLGTRFSMDREGRLILVPHRNQKIIAPSSKTKASSRC